MHDPAADMPDGYVIFDPKDPFENKAGPFFYDPRKDGPPEIVLKARDDHCNSYGIVHGALMITMADLTLAITARYGTDDKQIVTVSMNTDFLHAGHSGDWLTCNAEVVRRAGSLVFMNAKVRSDDRVLLNIAAVMKRFK